MTTEPDAPGSSEEEPVHGWSWTLFTSARESAVELWNDDEIRLTIPLTADQVELLVGHPVTLASAMEGFPGLSQPPAGNDDPGEIPS